MVESAGASVEKMGVLTLCACGNQSGQSSIVLATSERDGKIQGAFEMGELCAEGICCWKSEGEEGRIQKMTISIPKRSSSPNHQGLLTRQLENAYSSLGIFSLDRISTQAQSRRSHRRYSILNQLLEIQSVGQASHTAAHGGIEIAPHRTIRPQLQQSGQL
jgi:hypothetical protein